jgi:hypothetical protein
MRCPMASCTVDSSPVERAGQWAVKVEVPPTARLVPARRKHVRAVLDRHCFAVCSLWTVKPRSPWDPNDASRRVPSPYPSCDCAALTIATMPALTASGSVLQPATTSAKSGSVGTDSGESVQPSVQRRDSTAVF